PSRNMQVVRPLDVDPQRRQPFDCFRKGDASRQRHELRRALRVTACATGSQDHRHIQTTRGWRVPGATTTATSRRLFVGCDNQAFAIALPSERRGDVVCRTYRVVMEDGASDPAEAVARALNRLSEIARQIRWARAQS